LFYTVTYCYGFNGKENDNEVKGTGNQQDYGMRIYDPRLGKFLSVDPLTKKYAELTPYQFASNRPIDGVDLDGKEYFNSTTISSWGIGGAGGVGFGVNLALRTGTASDMIGKTYFNAYTALHPGNQDLDDGTSNPQVIIGAEAGADVAVQWVHKPTFHEAFNYVSAASISTVSAKFGLGGSLTVGGGEYDGLMTLGLSGGLGIGGSIRTGNQTYLSSSYSITYSQVTQITNLSKSTPQSIPYGFNSLRVNNPTEIKDKDGKITGYSGMLQAFGSQPTENGLVTGWYDTGIQMQSGVTQKNNKRVTDDLWKSNEYIKKEQEITKE
jgi:RHS repeat-associated protein